jgi:hypothetical protein
MGKDTLPRTYTRKSLLGTEIHMYCDSCQQEYVAKAKGIGSALSGAAGSLIGSALGGSARRAARAVGRQALSREAMSAVKETLTQCPDCGKWVCASCWIKDASLCKTCAAPQSEDSPSEDSQAAMDAATRAQVDMARSSINMASKMASMAAGFQGQIPSAAMQSEMNCPNCGNTTAPGKFCSECGKPLFQECPKCHGLQPAKTKFCSNCGTDLQG